MDCVSSKKELNVGFDFTNLIKSRFFEKFPDCICNGLAKEINPDDEKNF